MTHSTGPVGWTRKGRAIWPVRGAEDPPTTVEEAVRRLDSVRADLVRERDRRHGAESREQEQRRLVDERTSERDTARQQAAAGAGDVDQRIAAARTEGHTAGKAAADAEWTPRLVKQTAALVTTRARQAALDAGIKPEGTPPEGAPDRVGRFLALVDLNGVTGDDGEIKADDLATRVKTAATANPEFVTASTGGGGTTFTAAPGSGQGAGGGPTDQFAAKVDTAVGDMLRTLRIPQPAQNTT